MSRNTAPEGTCRSQGRRFRGNHRNTRMTTALESSTLGKEGIGGPNVFKAGYLITAGTVGACADRAAVWTANAVRVIAGILLERSRWRAFRNAAGMRKDEHEGSISPGRNVVSLSKSRPAEMDLSV